ncbi:MAG: sulfite exporter TauE/SafE family protein [Coriobacteriia bacterium]|nr:sulfite exporter TauE/SafE family protein [Coriobacteriia bacterium]MDO9107522.1 sulfite exporter TauE/SafE family protein [Coriobacteriia bacterium]
MSVTEQLNASLWALGIGTVLIVTIYLVVSNAWYRSATGDRIPETDLKPSPIGMVDEYPEGLAEAHGGATSPHGARAPRSAWLFQAAYHGGRLTTYAVIGALLGLLGGMGRLSTLEGPFALAGVRSGQRPCRRALPWLAHGRNGAGYPDSWRIDLAASPAKPQGLVDDLGQHLRPMRTAASRQVDTRR